MFGSRFCEGVCDVLVGLLDVVVVVEVCGDLLVVEDFVEGRLEGFDVVVGGFAVEFGGVVCAFWAGPV